MLTLSIIYGIAGHTARSLQVYFGTWQQLATQSWLAFVILKCAQITLHQGAPGRRLGRQELLSLFGRAAIGRIVSSYFFIQACLSAPLGNVGWISAFPTSAFFAWWLFGQCISGRDWLLLTIGMAGVGIIVSADINIHDVPGEGEFYAVISTLATGLSALFGRTVTRERGVVLATSWVILFTAVIASIAAVLLEGGLILPPAEALPMLTLVSIMAALGSACSLYGFSYLKASTATALLSLGAVWAVVLGMIIYGEQPSLNSLVGGCVIVIAACMLTPAGKPRANTLKAVATC